MNYTKPQITNTEVASFVIMGQKAPVGNDSLDINVATAAAYSADE
jgi:hypothetical protein